MTDELKNEQMYILYGKGGKAEAFAYGEPWVAQAMYMDDWKYPTPEAAKEAWERFKTDRDKKK